MRALLLMPLMALLPASVNDGAIAPPLSVLLAGVTICSGDDGPLAAKPELLPGYGNGGFPMRSQETGRKDEQGFSTSARNEWEKSRRRLKPGLTRKAGRSRAAAH